jgi:hypothetical protein
LSEFVNCRVSPVEASYIQTWLGQSGYEFTPSEVQALVQADPGAWASAAEAIPRLQRASLRRE